MQITKNSVVSLHYRLQADNSEGDLVEETFGGQPLTFLFGAGQMIPTLKKTWKENLLVTNIHLGSPVKTHTARSIKKLLWIYRSIHLL